MFSGLAANEPSGCSGVVGADSRKWGHSSDIEKLHLIS